MAPETAWEGRHDWRSLPIRDLKLEIKGTALEPVLAEFARELDRAGIRKVKPVFYLSTEWGVPIDTVAIAIPFYLAHPELTKLHAERVGHIEGVHPADILRYLRHEMGHVLNYAYRLYERPEWIRHFGSMDQDYEEEYRPQPFSRRFVQHLPGFYAQKHPDEDWAETFAVWLTSDSDWRREYADWPVALAKLETCDRLVAETRDREPLLTAADLDEDVGQLSHSLDEFYGTDAGWSATFPAGLDGALRAAFDAVGKGDQPASALIRDLEQDIMRDVYRWTGHFPERTRGLLRHLARRADALGLSFPASQSSSAAVALTALVTALAMNYTRDGAYLG